VNGFDQEIRIFLFLLLSILNCLRCLAVPHKRMISALCCTASAAAAVKRQFSLEQATERVLERKKAHAMAVVTLETSKEEHTRKSSEREETITHAEALLARQIASCETKVEELGSVSTYINLCLPSQMPGCFRSVFPMRTCCYTW